MTLALGILVSGSGSNMEAILKAIAEKRLDAECKIVISNRPDVLALRRASAAGVKIAVLDHKRYESREHFDTDLVAVLVAEGVEWIALAGFMRVLTPIFLDAFSKRVVNIHPSLLPAFPGVNAQAQAFEYGVKVTGCTAHFVDGGVDTGPIIQQSAVPVLDTDTADSLKARILEQEHRIFVDALQKIALGEITYPKDGRRIAAPESQ